MSTSAGGALPPDLMLAHAGSIRALALSILGDEHAAEDVLQETWLRALNKPPPRQDSIGGWLRRVAEGIAISRLRSEGRRRNRETQWVEDRDCSHSSYDATERADVLRAVVDEVLALDEPYREAVMRRYFEGMPPRKIAEATDATVATVNSRLQRAQSKLRDRLDRRLSDRCGGMRGALLALVGWPEAAVTAGAAGWMSKALATKAIVGVAGAFAVVAAVALWLGTGDDERAPEATSSLASSSDASPARRELADDVATKDGARELVSLPAPRTSAVVGVPLAAPQPAPHPFELCVEPIDAKGIAVADCSVWLGPEPGPLALVGTTGWDGALRLSWRGDESEVAFVVRAARAGAGSTTLRRIRVRAGAERVVRITLDGGDATTTAPVDAEPQQDERTAQRVDATDRQIDPTPEQAGTAARPSGNGADARTPTGRTSGRPKRDEGRFLLDSAGNGVFLDPWLLAGPESASAASGFAALDPIRPTLSGGLANDWTGSRSNAVIELRVVDGSGRPVSSAPIVFRTAFGGFTTVTRTDAEGLARCETAPGSALATVGANGTTFPLVVRHFELEEGTTHTLEVVLPDAPIARLRLVGAKGEPRAGWLYELRDELGSTVGRGAFGAEGRAAVPIPNGAPVRLLARADATGPGVVVDSALIARELEQTLTAAFDPHVRTLRVLVRGGDASSSVVRVTRVDSGDALDAARADDVEPGDDGALAFRVRGLGHGWYRVAVGSPTRGWMDAGEHEITTGRGNEVVRVTLDEPARLEVANGDVARARALGHRAGLRIVSADVATTEGRRITAAPGALDLLVERPEMPPTIRPIELAPGATTRIE